MPKLTKIALIAPCGMNCAICHAYQRPKNKCPGCRVFNDVKPVTIARCKIKTCATLKSRKLKYCIGCESFPCAIIKHLDKRYRAKYHMSMIENLTNIKRYGIRKFVRDETVRWRCPTCGSSICVHKGYCLNCHDRG
jgi:hypothetical protein